MADLLYSPGTLLCTCSCPESPRRILWLPYDQMASALLLLLLLSLASALSFSHQRGLIFNLDNGELCLQSAQCKSSCCHKTGVLSLARCANRAAENQECSPKSIYGVYYKCPCENGLTCEADKSIVGSITNTNYGICQDPGSSSK